MPLTDVQARAVVAAVVSLRNLRRDLALHTNGGSYREARTLRREAEETELQIAQLIADEE